jgi:hypothetical protein
MCDLLKISGMQDEIFYLRKEIDICKCRLRELNKTTVIQVKICVEVSTINKTVMQKLLDEISILKDIRLELLSCLFEKEYVSIQLNTNICENMKQILVNMITHLYVPYNMHRENEIRNTFAQMMLKN